MNGVGIHTRVHRYEITSTLRLLLRGDPQDEGLDRLQPRTLYSKLDYFYAGLILRGYTGSPCSPVGAKSLKQLQTEQNLNLKYLVIYKKRR